MINKKTVLLLFALCAIYLTHSLIYWNWIEDDTFITLRYSANLLDGHGLVYNIGERVEGYSNFSWVLLGALAMKMGQDPVAFLKIIGIISGLLCLLISWDLSRRILQSNSWSCLLAPAIIAFSAPMTRHSTTGFETLFFSFLMIIAFWLLQKQRNSALVITLLVMSMTRPEGFIFAFLFLAPLVMKKQKMVAVGFAVPWSIYHIWRWSYFGFFFPNTYYAKMTGTFAEIKDGIHYSFEFIQDCNVIPILILVLIPFVFWKNRPLLTHLYLILFAYVGFIVTTGGDWMSQYRFFAPILPLLAVTSAVGLADLQSSLSAIFTANQQKRFILMLALVTSLSMFISIRNERTVWKHFGPQIEQGGYWAQSYTTVGKWLAENTPHDIAIAVSDIGAIGYFSERRIIDMFGLTDVHIARIKGKIHLKADPQYVLNQRPDFVVLVRTGEKADQYYHRIPDEMLWELNQFQDEYILVEEFPMHGAEEIIELYQVLE